MCDVYCVEMRTCVSLLLSGAAPSLFLSRISLFNVPPPSYFGCCGSTRPKEAHLGRSQGGGCHFSPSTCRHASTSPPQAPASQGCPGVSRFHRALGCRFSFLEDPKDLPDVDFTTTATARLRILSNISREVLYSTQPSAVPRRSVRAPGDNLEPDAQPFPRFGPSRLRQPYN